jgi:hypothetical protein
VTYPSFGNFIRSKKNYNFRGQKGENKPSGPKNGIWGPKSVGRVTYSSFGNFIRSKKNYTFSGQKSENKPQGQKTEFAA